MVKDGGGQLIKRGPGQENDFQKLEFLYFSNKTM
jgi:hypothetical protein